MLLEIEPKTIVYYVMFLLFFILSYFIINATRFESLFKQGKVWQIVASQMIVSIIIAWLLSQAFISLSF